MPITIIGTSHIAKESIRKVKGAITDEPQIIAVELDSKRYYALTHEVQRPRFSLYSITRVGLKGFIFAAIGSWASNRLGRMVGVEPGEEMKTAIRLAKGKRHRVALIDRDIEVTLNRFSRFLTWKERRNFVADLFNGLFFRDREMRKYGINNLDLNKVPGDELIKKLMNMMKERYPTVYQVLVDERNHFMAERLKRLSVANPEMEIVAVVGAGHVEGIRELLSIPEVSYSYTIDARTVNYML